MADTQQKTFRSTQGFSLIELLIVIALIGVLTAVAVPAMLNQRRLLRTNAVGREIMTQMRYARQLSMSSRQSVTFEYNDAATMKRIRIINHHNNEAANPTCNLGIPVPPATVVPNYRTAIFGVAGFPLTGCSTVASTVSLAQSGLPAYEISYGAPAGLPTTLGDLTVMTALTGSTLNITFQPDGSVINALGFPDSRAMFFFNNVVAQSTATAISVVGASGRAKVWRYSANATKYVE